MPLRYGLIENKLTADPDDYMAVAQDNETYGTEQIVDRMISRGSTVTKAEALGVFEELGLAVEDILKGGNNINTPIFCIYPSIAGVFNSEKDNFSPDRHSVRLNISAGNRLTKIIRDIQVEKVKAFTPAPVIEKFINLKSKAINETFTPGQIASITGLLLKFNEEDPNQGIFFISSDGTESRVTNITKNKPSELMFFVPDNLTTGSFEVEVRAILTGRKSLASDKLKFNLVPVS